MVFAPFMIRKKRKYSYYVLIAVLYIVFTVIDADRVIRFTRLVYITGSPINIFSIIGLMFKKGVSLYLILGMKQYLALHKSNQLRGGIYQEQEYQVID